MNPKLGSGISVVKLSETILEFFKSNTRQQVKIKTQDIKTLCSGRVLKNAVISSNFTPTVAGS